ncbi:TPA: hypothetical protein OL202_003646 [Clostridioides difficile]|nr:hypothetical protein [Clostridioides difficile]HCQ5433547.1 hypothetical protein [Clostridioides difficile]HCQ5482083.1 hypothetical protein [Clostridioides difficile]HCQ5815725.1 hypothetical protein [Clostridioides difficile]HCQ5819725.1 hypothetical protein [Clostridioides difficile]
MTLGVSRANVTRFRLTIWNVNFATYDGEMITLTGFILTMWYVKITFSQALTMMKKFYINYVDLKLKTLKTLT